MKMAKQLSEEFQGVSEVSCKSPNTKIHAVVESLSPMKKSKSCSYLTVVLPVSTRLSLYTSLLPQSVRLLLLCLTLF